MDSGGYRHELAEVNGISHFIEHMVFKGTQSRSAKQIAREVDAIGGNLDAFTGKETICFNVKVLDENVRLRSMCSPTWCCTRLQQRGHLREQGVILEEIKMDEDNPDYLVHEIFTQNFWKGHPLGRPILGTTETVRHFEQDTVIEYYGRRFSGTNGFFGGRKSRARCFVEQVSKRFDRSCPTAARLRKRLRGPYPGSCCAQEGARAGAALPGRALRRWRMSGAM